VTPRWKRLWIILGVLIVGGLVIAGTLYVTFPVQVATYGGMALNLDETRHRGNPGSAIDRSVAIFLSRAFREKAIRAATLPEVRNVE
jgi:hypothetical protein